MTRRNKLFTRRSFLTASASLLAAPALSQTRGVFDELGSNADPKDLIDQIWDPKTASYITIRDLLDRLVDAPVILLGERHGFAPHQDRAAFLLKALADRGRYPTLALEMLQPRHDAIVRRYRAHSPEYARRLGVALDWANSGWPDWSYYEPIFDAAFAAKLPIIGADLPLDEQRRIEREGTTGYPDDPDVLDSWRSTMRDANCFADNQKIDVLARKQWKRDLAMAQSVREKDALLLAGKEHIRPDRGIPTHLRGAVSLAFENTQRMGLDWFSWTTDIPPERPKLC